MTEPEPEPELQELPPDDPRVQLFGTVGFDKALKGLALVGVAEGRAQARIEVSEEVGNLMGTLHGGAIATLVDDVGTVAIMSGDKDGRPGVTTDLSISYMSAAPAGSTVIIDGRVLKVGRTLAFVEVELRRESDQKLLAQGRMTKFMGH